MVLSHLSVYHSENLFIIKHMKKQWFEFLFCCAFVTLLYMSGPYPKFKNNKNLWE